MIRSNPYRMSRSELWSASSACFLFALSALRLSGILSPVPTTRERLGPRAQSSPTLVVVFTIDQMRPDYFNRWQKQLKGGLLRLASGAFFTNAHQDHAITETAPGHSTILSGRFPQSTGITRNVAGVNDGDSPLLDAPGMGASPFRFRGTTLFDWIVETTPSSRALSVSYKDRGAILPIGRSKQEVYWYSVNGTFTTSRWYRDSLPGWVQAFNNQHLPQSYAGRSWDLLLPAESYSELDSVPIEGNGQAYLFPHGLSANPDTAAKYLPGYPFIDELTAAFALEGVNALRLGTGPAPDVLAVSLSGTDLIGHRYGPDSREVHDQIIRLDRTIGAFIDSLFKLRDSGQIAIVLTADHGVSPFPELNQGRLKPTPLRVDLTAALDAAQQVFADNGISPGGLAFENGALFLSRDSMKMSDRIAIMAVDAFIATARRTKGVLRADRPRDLTRRNLVKDVVARRWVQMFPADLPVAAVVTLVEGSYWAPYPPIAQHGTPHDQDTNVPMVFYGQWFRPGRYEEFVRTVDIAPTLARVLGIKADPTVDGHVLTAALR